MIRGGRLDWRSQKVEYTINAKEDCGGFLGELDKLVLLITREIQMYKINGHPILRDDYTNCV